MSTEKGKKGLSMKRMRTMLIITLALMLLLNGCAAFGSTAGSEDSGKETGMLQESDKGTTAPQETTEPEETTPPEKEISLGKWEGTTYTNRYIGGGFELDSAWSIRTAEELQAITGAVKDVYSETEFDALFESAQQVMDMQVENTAELVSMNLLYEKLTPAQKLSFLFATEEKLVDATLATKDSMIAAYEQAGIMDAQMEKVTVTFMGEQRTAIRTTAKISGVDYYILQFFDYNNGDYYTCLSLASYVTDKTTELMDLWFKVD